MNTFELEKVLKTFKPPGWNTEVFARNSLRSPTKKCVFICNTDCSHNEGTHWMALSINDQGEDLTLTNCHLSSKNSAHFLKVVFALTMMFNCKDLSHWPVGHYCALFALHTFAFAWRRLSTGWRNTAMNRLKTL